MANLLHPDPGGKGLLIGDAGHALGRHRDLVSRSQRVFARLKTWRSSQPISGGKNCPTKGCASERSGRHCRTPRGNTEPSPLISVVRTPLSPV